MPQRITPHRIITTTKDGECNVIISLDINININNGKLEISNTLEQIDTESTDWAIPEFASNSNMLHFGKDVEHEN